MEILHDRDVIPCLKKSNYYKAFLKTSDDGKILLHVPPEYIITNNELQNIDNYEDFFNILKKFNFYILPLPEYPTQIYDWIFDNLSKINIEHLLGSILNDTDIVKQINIIVNGGTDSDYTISKVHSELELAGYYHCAKIANEKGYKTTYGDFYYDFRMHKNLYVYNLTKESKKIFDKYDDISSRNEFKFSLCDLGNDLETFNMEFNKEFYFEEDIDESLIGTFLRCKFKFKYGIILTFENIKKFLLRIIEYYMIKEIKIINDRLIALDEAIKNMSTIYNDQLTYLPDFKNDKYVPIIRSKCTPISLNYLPIKRSKCVPNFEDELYGKKLNRSTYKKILRWENYNLNEKDVNSYICKPYNKLDLQKIKQIEFKRLHNKRYFSKHIR